MTANKLKWPDDGQPASFPDLVEPVCKALRQAYSMCRKNKNKDIKWTGPPQGRACRVSAFEHEEHLLKDNMKYSLEAQGRDALTEIVGIAVQLGIEQGERMFKTSGSYQFEETSLSIVEDMIKRMRERREE